MRPADERELKISDKSSRNGFIVMAALAFIFMSYAFLQHGLYAFELGMVFFLGQIVYWSSTVYYKKRN